MPHDRSTRGIVLAFAAFAAFSFSDASVKLLNGSLDQVESAFFGGFFGLFALPFLRRRQDRWRDVFATTNRPLWLVRFFASGIASIGSVTAFTHLSMAEAFALIFLLPSFVTIMSVFVLKEAVGIKRWSAVAIGFLGVLIILRPGFRELSIGHLGAVIGGLGGAISIIIFRAIGKEEKNLSLYGAGVLGWIAVCGVAMVPHFLWPTPTQWLMLTSYGLLSALGNVLLMLASKYTAPALVGPTQYSQMLWAILFGYLIFGDHADLPMLVGIVLIVGSGLLTLARERAKGVALPPSVAADPQAAIAILPEAADEKGGASNAAFH